MPDELLGESVKRSRSESVSILATVAIGASSVALLALGVAFQSTVAVMTGASDWAVGWIWPAFFVAALAAGLLSMVALSLLWRWRGLHDRGPLSIILLLGGAALGIQGAAWAWIEFWAYR